MSNNGDGLDSDRNMYFEDGVFSIHERIQVYRAFDIQLGDAIEVPFKYEKLLTFLRDLPPDTQFLNLYLTNFGGWIHGLIPLYNAFSKCGIPVHVYVAGENYSAAAVLALVGTSITFHPHSFLMFHNTSGGDEGKGKELYDAIVHGDKHIKELYTSLLQPFLTKDEVNRILNDKDCYVRWNSRGLKGRIKRHFGKRK